MLQKHQLSLREATRRRRHYPDPLNGMISAQAYYRFKVKAQELFKFKYNRPGTRVASHSRDYSLLQE
jgi:hypothetical protein